MLILEICIKMEWKNAWLSKRWDMMINIIVYKFDNLVLKRFDFSKTKIALSRNILAFFTFSKHIKSEFLNIYTSNNLLLNIFYTSFNNSLWFNCLHFFLYKLALTWTRLNVFTLLLLPLSYRAGLSKKTTTCF